MRSFLELQRSDDDLVDILELPTFINASLPQRYYLMKWTGGSVMIKNISLDSIYRFCLKTFTDDLN